EAASCQLVGRGDAVGLLHPVKHLDLTNVEVGTHSHGSQHRLHRPGGAMHFKSQIDEALDHMLNLLFCPALLHCDDHGSLLLTRLIRYQIRFAHWFVPAWPGSLPAAVCA